MTRPDLEPSRDGIGPVPNFQPPDGAPPAGPVRDFIPQTTHDKATLCVLIAPQITALADELYAFAMKTMGLRAEPDLVAQAAVLLRDAQRLLRGEPGAHLVDLSFASPMLLHALALGMRQVARAVTAFRERYYGYHPLAGTACWAVADPFGNPDPRWVGPRVPSELGIEISEVNLLTANVLRTQLLALAERTETRLPATLRAPEPEATPEPEPAPAPPASRNARRNQQRAAAARPNIGRPTPPPRPPSPSRPQRRPPGPGVRVF